MKTLFADVMGKSFYEKWIVNEPGVFYHRTSTLHIWNNTKLLMTLYRLLFSNLYNGIRSFVLVPWMQRQSPVVYLYFTFILANTEKEKKKKKKKKKKIIIK